MADAPELHTVADDHAVVFAGTEVRVYDGLASGRAYHLDGIELTTLPRPGGERLATVATVNDVHFGETECGRVEGHDVGPVLWSADGEPPYPQVMNAAVVAEIAALRPDAVVAKGDLTSRGTAAEYAAFEAVYRPPLGERLIVTRGNHDHPASGPCFDADPLRVVEVPGVALAALDTSRAGEGGGFLGDEQLEALDEYLRRADRPVLVLGHHPVRDADAEAFMGEASGLDGASTSALVGLAARRPAFAGYFAGHTHRNLVRRFPETGDVPFAEVACTKDFPGSWAEYRVFEGGILAVHHRARSPDALSWSERCRAMFFGLYPRWALGSIEDRCFVVC
ncbi:MAG: metallophosphoesterase family protein [Acidimicrobiales bacterium]